MNLHQCAVSTINGLADLMLWERPAEEPSGFVRAHVDAATAHRHTEILVPVRTVEGMSLRRKEQGPGNAGELIIVRIGKQVSVAHMFVRHLIQDAEITLRRLGRQTICPTRTVQDAG